jgi:hypothetical protein
MWHFLGGVEIQFCWLSEKLFPVDEKTYRITSVHSELLYFWFQGTLTPLVTWNTNPWGYFYPTGLQTC